MKKFFVFCMMALVTMCGLNSCSDDCNHDFIEHDFTQDLVGTWTFLEEDLAEAMVIKADGSFTTTGIRRGGSLYEEKGTIKVVNNKVTLAFDGDNETFEGRLEFVAGKSMSLVMFDDNDVRLTYDYCENDLSDELVGMWVCNDSKIDAQNNTLLQTFKGNGTTVMTGYLPEGEDAEYILNEEGKYKVVGDLLFLEISTNKGGDNNHLYVSKKMIYSPVASTLGDVMIFTNYSSDNSGLMSETWFRIKQSLNLAGKAYDYSATYISNAKGVDKDIPFLDTKFNFAHMDGSIIDKFLKSVLYNVQFPDAKTFQYNCLLEGQNVSLQLPMEVEGNKITIKMSSRHEAYRDVVVYAFQDVDGCQFHMYMPTASFENFFSNLSLSILSASGQVDINNPVHVDAVYKEVADAIESINVSIVMK